MMESFSEFIFAFVQKKDSIYYLLVLAAAVIFLAAEIGWRVFRKRFRASENFLNQAPADDSRFEVIWTLVPLFVLMLLSFVQAQHRPRNIQRLGKQELSSPSLKARVVSEGFSSSKRGS